MTQLGNLRHIVAIGDVHGELEKLERLLSSLEEWVRDPNTVLVFLGDYIDRGRHAKEVVDLLLALKKRRRGKTVFLMGNHEFMFMSYLAKRGLFPKQQKLRESFLDETFIVTGGEKTLASYSASTGCLSIPEEHIDFFNNLRLMYEDNHFLFVHAGLKPGVPISKQIIDDLLWIRWEFIDSDYDWGKRVVFGHTPFDEPLVMVNKIGIDTGAVYNGRLTGLILPEINFVFA